MKNHFHPTALSTGRTFFRSLPLLALAAVLLPILVGTGCMSQLKQPPLDKRFYEIRTAPKVESGPALVDIPLRVRRLNISPSSSGRELVYKTGATTFDSDFYNLYFIPPADMLTQDLLNWLRNKHIFSHVVDAASLVNTPYTLEGMVNVLYGDYTTEPGNAVVAMQFFLLDEKNTDKSILFSADYEETVPLESNSAQGLVKGLNTAVNKIFGALTEDLGRFMSTEQDHAEERN